MDPVSGSIPVITYGLTEALKKGFGDKDIFRRILPLLPIIMSFGLTFVPGLGMVSAPILAKLLFAIGAGGAAGSGNEIYKKLIRGWIKGKGKKTKS